MMMQPTSMFGAWKALKPNSCVTKPNVTTLTFNRSFLTNTKWSSMFVPRHVKFNKQVNIVVSNQSCVPLSKRWMVNIDSVKSKMNELPEEERQKLIQKLEDDLKQMENETQTGGQTNQYFKGKKMKLEDFRLFFFFMILILILVPIVASLVYGMTVRRRPRVKGTVSEVEENGYFSYIYKIGDIEVQGRDQIDKDHPVNVGDKVPVYVHPQNFIISLVYPKIFHNPLTDERGTVITEIQLEPPKNEDGKPNTFSLDSEAPPPVRASRQAWHKDSEKEIREKMEKKKQKQKEHQEKLQERHRQREQEKENENK